RHLPVRRGKVALKLETASSRHSHVENQASRAVPRSGLQEIGNRWKFLRMQPDRPQQPRDRVAKLVIVIDDQNAVDLVTHPGSSPKGSAFCSTLIMFALVALVHPFACGFRLYVKPNFSGWTRTSFDFVLKVEADSRSPKPSLRDVGTAQ